MFGTRGSWLFAVNRFVVGTKLSNCRRMHIVATDLNQLTKLTLQVVVAQDTEEITRIQVASLG